MIHIQYCREYNLAIANYGEKISNERINQNTRPSWNIPRNFHLQHYSNVITLSWVKIIKTCITEKLVKEFSSTLKILISTVKFSINEHHFSATISLRLVGLVTEE